MYHIIVNPIAGRRQSGAALLPLTVCFDTQGLPYTVQMTTAPLDARAMARRICAEGSQGIIGLGGDGTLQEIVSGMADALQGSAVIPIPLGILPCGSGNDFALSLLGKNNFKKLTAEALAADVAQNRTRAVDLIKSSNGMTCLNITNMGLDARIVRNAIQYKKRLKNSAYLAAVFTSILEHKNTPLTIEAGGETFSGSYTLAALCNGQYYGGGMRIAPGARLDDGQITLCLVEAISRPKTMVLFPSLLMEKHIHLREVRFVNCDKVTLSWEGEETLCMDGNLYDRRGPMTFEIMPAALRLFADSGLS